MVISGEQCRAARALLNIDQSVLAERAGISKHTILRFEIGRRIPTARTLRDIAVALESFGVEFTFETDVAGEGVRLKKGVKERLQAARLSGEAASDGASSPFDSDDARGALARVLFRQSRWFRLPRSTRRVLRAWLFVDRTEQRTML